MSFLEIFALFASGVTIFGVIVGVFSVYNGRMTRREIDGLIRETRDLIAREDEATRQIIRATQELIARGDERTQELIAREGEATRQLIRETREATLPILQGITEILGRIDERVR